MFIVLLISSKQIEPKSVKNNQEYVFLADYLFSTFSENVTLMNFQ